MNAVPSAVSTRAWGPAGQDGSILPVLELEGVTKVYGKRSPVHALRGVSLAVNPGELSAIVGPSGSGKTTLLHVMGTLERPSSGTIRYGEVDLWQYRAPMSPLPVGERSARSCAPGEGVQNEINHSRAPQPRR